VNTEALTRWRARCRRAAKTGEGLPKKGPFASAYPMHIRDAVRLVSGYRRADRGIDLLRRATKASHYQPEQKATFRLALAWLNHEIKVDRMLDNMKGKRP
jgi:hypothetical protein